MHSICSLIFQQSLHSATLISKFTQDNLLKHNLPNYLAPRKCLTLSWRPAEQLYGHLESLSLIVSPTHSNPQRHFLNKWRRTTEQLCAHSKVVDTLCATFASRQWRKAHHRAQVNHALEWRGGREHRKDFVLPKKQQMPEGVKPNRVGALHLTTQLFWTTIRPLEKYCFSNCVQKYSFCEQFSSSCFWRNLYWWLDSIQTSGCTCRANTVNCIYPQKIDICTTYSEIRLRHYLSLFMPWRRY